MSLRNPRCGSVFYVAAAAVAVMAAVYAMHSPTVHERRELAAREAALCARVRALWRRGVEIERFRDALKTDPVMIEWVARSRLGYGRPGETVYPQARGFPDGRRLFRPRPASRAEERPGWAEIAREAMFPAAVLIAVFLGMAVLLGTFSLEDGTAETRFA